MATAIPKLPDRQSQALLEAYLSASRSRRLRTLVILAVFLILIVISAYMAEIRPATFFSKIGNFGNYLVRIVPPIAPETFFADVGKWYWNVDGWSALLFETLLIAYLGTVLGGVGAFVLCFLASANLTRGRTVRFTARRFLEFCRTVPDIVFALIFVIAFGLGPMAGVLALSIHTMGSLGKLFSEVVENIDMKPIEGLQATGATWVETVRFAVLPQVLPGFTSYFLLRFEVNVRGAGVMGFVGAGGIGQELRVAIRSFYYADVSAILLMIVLTVMIIDMLTERLRHRLVEVEALRLTDATAVAGPASLREEARADEARLRRLHPEAFASPWPKRLVQIGIAVAIVGFVLFAMVWLDFSLQRLLAGAHRLGDFVILMFPPDPGPRLMPLLQGMAQTLAIAFLGTLAAALLAFPFALLAAKNIIPNVFVHFTVRRGFDIIRSIDVLIWALMWINVVGLGPFAGALAIACSDFGSFGKLFSEAIEATDRKAAEGVAASGGSRLHQIRFGLLPQAFPVIASLVLYFFESNTRSATIIGIVGAGGIGIYLSEAIRVLELRELAFIILMILVVVGAIDFISTRLRLAIIGRTTIAG